MTTVVLPQAAYSGNVTTLSVEVPPDALQLEFACDIDATDLVDPALSVGANVEQSPDDNDPWTVFAQFGWQGNVGNIRQPVIRMPGDIAAGTWVRLVLTIPQTVRVGATITFA